MAYRFKPRKTVAQNVKRIASAEIASAIEYLRGKNGVSREDAVHEVRKSIKKARALLRLVEGELGTFYDEENSQLRDTGRQLSNLRDAGALVDAVDHLRKRANGVVAAKPVSDLRRLLALQKRHMEEEAGTQKLMPGLAASLVRVRRSIRYWPLEKDGFPAIEAGLDKTFRDGRKALARARRSGSREDFHEWRKRVKDHWYHVRLFQKMGGDQLDRYRRSLKELEDALGEDVNLAILAERVQALTSANGSGVKAASLNKAIDSARGDLRQRALKIGEKIYAGKPKQFSRQIRKLWKSR